jgi:hypothetical protein
MRPALRLLPLSWGLRFTFLFYPLAKSFSLGGKAGRIAYLLTIPSRGPGGRFGEGYRYRSWPVAPEKYVDSPKDPIAR